MTTDFRWTCSYMNGCWYKFYRDGGGEIEVHRPMEDHMLAYRQSIFNHNGNPFSFQRNVLDAVGGAQVSWSHYNRDNWNRWTEPLWEAFVAWLKAEHERDYAWCDKFQREHEFYDFPLPVLTLPRPIYWDLAENCWKTEPFYQEVRRAA